MSALASFCSLALESVFTRRSRAAQNLALNHGDGVDSHPPCLRKAEEQEHDAEAEDLSVPMVGKDHWQQSEQEIPHDVKGCKIVAFDGKSLKHKAVASHDDCA